MPCTPPSPVQATHVRMVALLVSWRVPAWHPPPCRPQRLLVSSQLCRVLLPLQTLLPLHLPLQVLLVAPPGRGCRNGPRCHGHPGRRLRNGHGSRGRRPQGRHCLMNRPPGSCRWLAPHLGMLELLCLQVRVVVLHVLVLVVVVVGLHVHVRLHLPHLHAYDQVYPSCPSTSGCCASLDLHVDVQHEQVEHQLSYQQCARH